MIIESSTFEARRLIEWKQYRHALTYFFNLFIGIKTMSKKTPITPKSAARIQSATAKQNGGSVPKGSFASRAQSAAARNTANTAGSENKKK